MRTEPSKLEFERNALISGSSFKKFIRFSAPVLNSAEETLSMSQHVFFPWKSGTLSKMLMKSEYIEVLGDTKFLDVSICSGGIERRSKFKAFLEGYSAAAWRSRTKGAVALI